MREIDSDRSHCAGTACHARAHTHARQTLHVWTTVACTTAVSRAYIRTRCSADMMQNSVELWKIHRMRNGGVHVGHSHGWCRVPSVMVWSWCCSVQEQLEP